VQLQLLADFHMTLSHSAAVFRSYRHEEKCCHKWCARTLSGAAIGHCKRYEVAADRTKLTFEAALAKVPVMHALNAIE
jgi:hypothetical protein